MPGKDGCTVKSTMRDMTVGSPWKLIAGFALPVLLSQIFQQLYNTADSLIVGRFLGDEALAAVSSSGPLIFLMTSFFEGLDPRRGRCHLALLWSRRRRTGASAPSTQIFS